MQRRSIFGGLLVILLGLLFLLHYFVPGLGVGRIFSRYWPVLLILWGVAKLVDHLTSRRSDQARPPLLSGSEAALLALILVVGGGMFVYEIIQQKDPGLTCNIHLFGQRYSQSQELPPKTIPSGTHLTITTSRGNITVRGGEGNDVRVTVNESAYGASERGAQAAMKPVKVVIEQSSDGYAIHPQNQEDSSAEVSVDLDVQVPKKVKLTANASRGDITISGVTGSITAGTSSGDMEIHGVGGDVEAHLQKGDARISNVTGNLRIEGRGNEIEVTDVQGDATLAGEFYGPIRIRNVASTTHYSSARSDITLLHLTGRLELDSGQVSISDVAGTAKISTRNKDIDVENVAGRLEISDMHGDIQVRFSNPPHEEVNIGNESGGVDLTLPARSSFQIFAASRSGEVESDFEDPGLKPSNDNETGKLAGRFGSLGPKITIGTSYGTIYLRKSA